MSKYNHVIDYPGNPRPIVRRDQSATTIILPVIRIERYIDHDDAPVRKLDRRKGRRDQR